MLPFPLEGDRALVSASHQPADLHILGKMHVIANLLSRKDQTLPTEWSLNLETTRHLFLLWGSPQVDFFATRWNIKLLTFVSLVPDPQALMVDALSLSWQKLWAYTFPLHQLLTKVLTKLRQSNAQLLLMAPAWPAQPWFPDLLDLSVDHHGQLPVMETLLKQPRSDRFHLDPGRHQLHAWKLSGDLSEKKPDSPEIQQRELQPPKLHPPSQSMTGNGAYSVLDVVDGKQILSLPLFP